MSQMVSRYEDMGNGILSISQDDGVIKMTTIPPMSAITFTGSGGESRNTLIALRKLFREMKKDNEEIIQEDVINEKQSQSRFDDIGSGKIGESGELVISDYGDSKLSAIPKEDRLIFKSPETGGKSPNMYQSMMELIEAMLQDDKERPQSRPWIEKEHQ